MRLEHPIFLLSSERSGSNLLRAIMGAHTNVFAPSPPHLLNTFMPLLPAYGNLKEKKHFYRLSQDVVTALQNQLSPWHSDFTAEELVENADIHSLMGIIDYVYFKENKQRKNAQRVFFKEIDTHEYVFQILRVFPDARFIYLIRDPRDFVLSAFNSPNHPGNIENFSYQWKYEQSKILRLYSQLMLEDKITHVHYEDLLANPGGVIQNICRFIGEEVQDSMMEFFKEGQMKREAEDIKNWSNLKKPIQKDNYQKFSKSFSKKSLNSIEFFVKQEMILCDYPLMTNAKISSTSGMGKTLKKGGQLLTKILKGKTMPLQEMATRSNQIKTTNTIRDQLFGELKPLLKRQFSSYTNP